MAVWLNEFETENGTRYARSITFAPRRFRDRKTDEWRDGAFRPVDLPALLLAIEMGVAIWKVHSTGSYLAVHNYEFPLAVLAGSFALATVGAGLLSLDHPLLERGGKSRFPRNSKLAR